MKKIIVSAGIAALGAASLQAAAAPGASHMDKSKPWSVSASLRGFYDDNYTARPSEFEEDSFGFALSPTIAFHMPVNEGQTYLAASYTYEMRYYEARDNNSADHFHTFRGSLDHSFSERYSISLSDTFLYSDEPSVDPSGAVSAPLRTNAEHIRNHARLSFDAELTELLGLGFGYSNIYWNFDQEGVGSRSALLDRMEHLANVDLRWIALPTTTGILGYQFGLVDYTSDDDIAPGIDSDVRNSTSHFLYVGVDHSFSSKFSASARVGGQYVHWPDTPNSDDDDISPYIDLSGTYVYNPGSYLQLGFKHIRNQTDLAGFTGTEVTMDQETSLVYGSLSHRITSRLTGSLTGQYTDSSFEGGLHDGDTDQFLMAGVNFDYKFDEHWSGEVGYNYDKLNSDISGRGFTRNRVYVGVRASY